MHFSTAYLLRSRLAAGAAVCLLAWVVPAAAQGLADLRRAFENPPDDARILMRWWWFGPAVTKPELEREMRRMKEGGIGGFEIQPVYPVALDDARTGIRTLPFLSGEFLDTLRFTRQKARELGLRMDLTVGSGWPYGGPHVPIAEAAGRLRVERVRAASRRVPLPAITAGETLLAAFGANRELDQIRDGVLWLPQDLERPAEITFFIAGRTGMMVKRPAVGAEGFVLDHYDRKALEHYLQQVGDPMLRILDGDPPYAVFCDSLEVYGADWTADFLEEFRRRRGYDLKPHLPDLVANGRPNTPALRHDWGRTLTELLNERFLAPMQEWARRNQTRFRAQVYGTPPAALSSYAYADLPEGEGSQWKALRASRWASSASHLYGRPVTSSETWTWLHSPAFRATPLDVKAEADLHFLQGINQLIGHGWPYTAEGVEYPGWRFYAAAVFNDQNPWWPVMPDLTRYLQRLSFLLRQGRPVNDVALYLPNSDAWAHLSPGRVDLLRELADRLGPNVVARILEAGYNLDFFDDGTVEQALQAHKIVVLPGVQTMPPATLRRLEEFARSGGGVVATRRLPQSAPGFLASKAEHDEIWELSRKLFQGADARGRFVMDEKDLSGELAALLRPDVSLSPPVPEMGFVHRRTASAEIYFLANTENVRRRTHAAFRVSGLGAEWWDPMTGRAAPAEIAGRSPGSTTLALDLEPYASRVLVFSREAGAPPAPRTTAAPPPSLDLSAGWKVTFGNHEPAAMERLHSWTDDEDTRYYSGLAAYEKEITVPESFLRSGLAVRLDFGEGTPLAPAPRRNGMQAWLEGPVREAAVVYVNDRRAGSVWCPPYSLEVTGLLGAGTNRLRIVVGNLAINHMAGRSLPDYRLLNLRYGVRFDPQDMQNLQPVPSGLLGPIRLVAAR